MHKEEKLESTLREFKDLIINYVTFSSSERRLVIDDRKSEHIEFTESTIYQNQSGDLEWEEHQKIMKKSGYNPETYQHRFDSKAFDALAAKEKIYLTKIAFGFLAKSKYIGMIGRNFVKELQAYILDSVISGFPENVKFELAYERVKYEGCTIIEKLFYLNEDQKQELREKAQKEVRAWLPSFPDHLISKYIETDNRIELHYKIYQRFSGKFKQPILSPKTLELIELVSGSNSKLHEWLPVLKAAMLEQVIYFQNKGWCSWPAILKPTQWKGAKADPNEVIPFSHGGGGFHCLEVLAGISNGYLSDTQQEMGIYVDPNKQANRDFFYSSRALPHLDFRVKFESEIQAKFLINTKNYEYEAIFPCNYRERLGKCIITPFNHVYVQIISEWVSKFSISLKITQSLGFDESQSIPIKEQDPVPSAASEESKQLSDQIKASDIATSIKTENEKKNEPTPSFNKNSPSNINENKFIQVENQSPSPSSKPNEQPAQSLNPANALGKIAYKDKEIKINDNKGKNRLASSAKHIEFEAKLSHDEAWEKLTHFLTSLIVHLNALNPYRKNTISRFFSIPAIGFHDKLELINYLEKHLGQPNISESPEEIFKKIFIKIKIYKSCLYINRNGYLFQSKSRYLENLENFFSMYKNGLEALKSNGNENLVTGLFRSLPQNLTLNVRAT